MIRWVPFDKCRPCGSSMEYEVITAHGWQMNLWWNGFDWQESEAYQHDGKTYTRRHEVYYPIAFWRWVPEGDK